MKVIVQLLQKNIKISANGSSYKRYTIDNPIIPCNTVAAIASRPW